MENKLTSEELQELKRQGLTDEEIRSGKLDIFEHIGTPTDKIDVISIMRLLDIVPVMEQELLDTLIDKLTAQGLFKQALKARLKKISNLLDFVNQEVWKTCDRSGDKTHYSQESWYRGLFDFSTKFTNALVNYVHNIELLTNASHTLSEKDQNLEIIRKSTFLGKLNPGDIFTFLDSSVFCEYTFDRIEWKEDTQEYIMFFYKMPNPGVPHSSKIEIYDNRIWRPVMVMNLLSEEELLNLKKKIYES